jgi:uncharacterized glyoxalase superfamily protein PhnB/DNA-binding XRE family transcriptional regulator
MDTDPTDAYEIDLTNYLKALGQNVRTLRAAVSPRLSQEHLADLARLHRTEIGKIEQGKVDPHLTTLHLVANALDATLDDLAKGLPVPPKRDSWGRYKRGELDSDPIPETATLPSEPAKPEDEMAPTPTLITNRSIPSATVIPVLTYPAVREAVDWLCAAFGFAERVRIGDDHRSQLSFGDGAIIVGDVRADRRPPRPGEVTQSVMVRVADIDAHCERARAHGARVVMEPTDFPYGERQYTADDPAGHQWTFSQSIADIAPEEWGGTSIAPATPN